MGKIELGLCCICLSLKEEGAAYKTVTAKHFESLPRNAAVEKLENICLNNAAVAAKIIEFCAQNGISHYRLPSDIFPLFTLQRLNLSPDFLPRRCEIFKALRNVGKTAKKCGVGLSTHPSQFTVFASANAEIRKNSAIEINFNARILDLAGLPKSPESPINVHINSNPDRPSFVSDFEDGLSMLSPSARKRLAVENEDRGAWNVSRLAGFLTKYKIPLTFDFLHHKLNNCGESEKSAFIAAAKTWGEYTPIFHYAESASLEKPREHSDYCKNFPPYFGTPYICQIEAKKKDLAIERLINEHAKNSRRRNSRACGNRASGLLRNPTRDKDEKRRGFKIVHGQVARNRKV